MAAPRRKRVLNPFQHKQSRNARLTPADVKWVKAQLIGGSTARSIAEKLGVSEQAICDIRKGRNWSWVTP